MADFNYIAPRAGFEYNWRIGRQHSQVYHGISKWNGTMTALQVIRSGVYAPRCWWGENSLVVDARLAHLMESTFSISTFPVVFDKLVDLPMPALGTNLSHGKGEAPEDDLLQELPDISELHSKIGVYRYLVPEDYPRSTQQTDEKELPIKFGAYNGVPDVTVRFSQSFGEAHPLVRFGAVLQLNETLFEFLCTHLTPDFFAIKYLLPWSYWRDDDDDDN